MTKEKLTEIVRKSLIDTMKCDLPCGEYKKTLKDIIPLDRSYFDADRFIYSCKNGHENRISRIIDEEVNFLIKVNNEYYLQKYGKLD